MSSDTLPWLPVLEERQFANTPERVTHSSALFPPYPPAPESSIHYATALHSARPTTRPKKRANRERQHQTGSATHRQQKQPPHTPPQHTPKPPPPSRPALATPLWIAEKGEKALPPPKALSFAKKKKRERERERE